MQQLRNSNSLGSLRQKKKPKKKTFAVIQKDSLSDCTGYCCSSLHRFLPFLNYCTGHCYFWDAAQDTAVLKIRGLQSLEIQPSFISLLVTSVLRWRKQQLALLRRHTACRNLSHAEEHLKWLCLTAPTLLSSLLSLYLDVPSSCFDVDIGLKAGLLKIIVSGLEPDMPLRPPDIASNCFKLCTFEEIRKIADS